MKGLERILTGRASFLALAIAALTLLPSIAAAQGPLINGENHTGSISTPAETDQWTLAASAGDYLVLSIGEVGADSAFWPWIRLVAPNGTLIAQSFGPLAGQIGMEAPSSGTYTVLVASNDSARSATGSYQLTLARIPDALHIPPDDEGGAMTNGANHAGVIHRADLDQWTFPAAAGDAIVLSIGEVGADSPFWPWLRLFGPDGTFIAQAFGPLAAQIIQTATSTGTYTVIVASNDSARSQEGSYVLTLAKTPGDFVVPEGDEGGRMTNGQNHTGFIGRGDLDQWRFVANAGDSLILSIGEVGADSTFWPWIRLLGPNGALLDQGFGPLAGQVIHTAPSTGTYTVLVGSNDSARAASGNYMLTLARVSGRFVVPVGDEGGPLANTVPHQGVIHRADLDLWTFMATAGSLVTIGAGEVGGDSAFWPWIRLYAPSGAFLTQAFGPQGAQISVNVPVSGLYTAVVASNDSARAASGFYTIAATGIIDQPVANSLGDVAVDFGPAYGVWLHTNHTGPTPQWLQLNGQSPTRIARGDVDGNGTVDLIANFRGYGVWIWKSHTGWVQLHAFDASDIATGDLDGNGMDEIILSFPNIGVWARYNDSTWRQLHTLSTTALAAGNIDADDGDKSDLIVTFPGNGVWAYINSASWVQLHGLSADQIQAGDLDGNGQDDIVLNFPGQGIWIRSNNSNWSQLHSLNAAGMTIGDIDGDAGHRKDVVINFSGYGVYGWLNGSSWLQLHPLSAPILVTADLDNSGKDDVVMNFTGYGVWLYRNNAGYEQLHPAEANAIAAGRFDTR